MKTGTKVSIILTGIILIALGVLCICKPMGALLSSSWILGGILAASGISTFLIWINVHRWMLRSSHLLFSSIFQVILAVICFDHSLTVAVSLPVIFALWLLAEGINLTIHSFDYKKIGFKAWWCMLLLGICSVALAICCLHNPVEAGKTLAILLGVGICALGLIYVVAFFGITRFEKNARALLKSFEEYI